MATFARGGRISTEIVDEKIARLRAVWSSEGGPSPLAGVLGDEQLAELAPSTACSSSTSWRWRAADRLRKYLARFGLEWSALRA